MREVVGGQVAVYETCRELDGPIFQEEMAGLGAVVESRRREFLTGRACARRALAELGAPTSPIPKGESGVPVWPRGVVGSITHCPGYRAAAVAWSSDIESMGIDAEPNQPLPVGVLDLIASPSEQNHLECIREELGGTAVDRLLFCIKEALFKAWSPVEHVWLDFLEAEVEIHAGGSFAARIDVKDPAVDFPRVVVGRWKKSDGRLHAGLVLRR